MTAFKAMVSVCLLVGLLAGGASALNMETVLVGNAGNAGELSGSGAGAGGYGPDRICGAVAYDYRIGTHEVTSSQYAEFLNAVAKTDTYGLYNTSMSSTTLGSGITRSGTSGSYSYSVASDFVNRPVNNVSYWDSCRFANWLHNGQGNAGTETGAYTLGGYNGSDGRTIQRNTNWQWAVSNEDEWYKVAYYKGGSTNAGYWDYPTSSNTAPGRDMADASGNNANYYTGSNPYPIDSPYYTTVVGEFQNSDSPYGTFDQGGNVWEWNEAIVYDGYSNRGLRGGSFSYGYYVYLHASNRYSYYPTSEGIYVGFRVVQVPEPVTIVMLALAGVGIIRRRKA